MTPSNYSLEVAMCVVTLYCCLFYIFSLDISSTDPLASSSSDSDDNDGAIIALSTLFSLAVVGLVASILINAFLFVKLKRSRSTIGSTNQSCKEINNGNQTTDTKHR